MAVHFRVRTTDSRPENLQVTQDLERRYKEQEAAKQTSKTKAPGTFKAESARQEQP